MRENKEPLQTMELQDQQSSEAELQSILADETISEKTREKISHILMVQHHQGPLPSPRMIAEYENIVSGAADRIISMAEESLAQNRLKIETNHELSLQDNSIERVGIILAFLFALLFGLGGIFLIYCGHPVTGSIVSGTTIIAVVSSLVKGRSRSL